MDKLSSVLETFRPTATLVDCYAVPSSSLLVLSTDACYWFYLVEGQLEILTSQSDKRRRNEQDSLLLNSGDGLWLPSGQDITLRRLSEKACLLRCDYTFGSKQLNPLLDSQSQWIKVTKGDNVATYLAPMTALLLQENLDPHCGSKVVVARLAEAYLIQLLRFFLQFYIINVGLMAGLSDDKLAKAIVAMHDAPDKDWQVSSLAAEAGMSRSGFSSHFKQTLNMTPMGYLTSWRMRLAGQRLINGEHNLAILSQTLGYQSEAAFRRTFKKYMGIAPGAMLRESKRTALNH
ncbi:AraC family transcriptional regulator [Marinomonas sp.]|uniref:AraC family transcriptional regulator n=1 Tax=Marinomonas sp. TaxID=1904862 RepID=UPI003BA86555